VIQDGITARFGHSRGSLRLSALSDLLAREGMIVMMLSFCVAVLTTLMPFMLVGDSWLSFVGGRLIAAHGLPHHDSLTLWTLGRQWTDQQWGAQLLLYETVKHGGVPVVVGLGVVCVVSALVLIAIAARELGASARSVALALPLPLFATPWLTNLRSQTFAVVLFVAVYALLVLDARRASKRILLVLPLLVLWANLHGTVVLGVVLAVAYGLSLLRRPGRRRLGVLLAVASPPTLVASPYGLHLVGYYRLMLVHPPLARLVSEWRPPVVGYTTAIFFASALVACAWWGTHRRVLTPFERWALPALLVPALLAIRNTIWFELALALAIPRLLDVSWPSRRTLTRQSKRANLLLAATASLVALSLFAVTLTRPSGWFERLGTPADAAAIASAAGPHGVVLADDKHADWLLWQQPSLAGRLAYDIRFELLSGPELHEILLLHQLSRSAWERCGSTARIVTFATPADERRARREQVIAADARTLLRTSALVAVEQPYPRHQGCGL
jgi:hypothetical protein